MKKIQLIELVTDFLASDQTEDMISQYHPEIIAGYLNMAYNQAVYMTWLDGKKFSDYSQLDAWTRTYRLALYNPVVAGSPSRVSGNIRLPYPPVQLPNNMGIRQVALAENESVVFAYIENTAKVIFDELEVGTIDPIPNFRLEQNDSGAGVESHILKVEKISSDYYDPLATTSIDVKLIVPFDQIGDYDDIAIPAGKEDLLVKQAIELIQNKPPEDTVNDQIANRPNQ